MYTLIETKRETVITYKTQCGNVVRVARVLDIGTADMRVMLAEDMLGKPIAANMLRGIVALLDTTGE